MLNCRFCSAADDGFEAKSGSVNIINGDAKQSVVVFEDIFEIKPCWMANAYELVTTYRLTMEALTGETVNGEHIRGERIFFVVFSCFFVHPLADGHRDRVFGVS